MDEDRIVLDRKAFGALAVDSRVKLLKALRERRKMLTELADELKLSASSTKEHLEMLLKADLVEKFDDGHKWKYYSLTKKGAGIITPDREIKVWVILGMSILGLLASSLFMFNALPGAASEAPEAMMLTAAAPAASANVSVQADILPAKNITPASNKLPSSPYVIFAAICTLVAVGCIVYLAIKKAQQDNV